MNYRFFSLKWKLLLLMSGILFVIALGVSWVSYLHEEQLLQSTQQKHHQQSAIDLEAQTKAVQQRLTKRLQYLSLLVQTDSQPLTTAQLVSNLNRHFSFVSMLWNVEAFQAHTASQGRVLEKGDANPQLERLNREAIETEQPVIGLDCEGGCRTLASIPILLADGETGSLGLTTSLAEVVIGAHQRTGWDTGVLLQAKSSETATLPEWNLNLVALSSKERVLPQLQALASLRPFNGAGSYQQRLGDKNLEVSLIPLAGLDDNQHAYWVQIADVSADYADIQRTFITQLLITLAALLFSGLLLVGLLQGPLNKLALVASTLPSLARRDFGHVREQLQHSTPYLFSQADDELTILVASTIQLGDELERLDRAMRMRNLKLQRSSQQLSRQRDFASGLLDNAQAVILVQDTQGRCRSLNRFGCRLLNVPAQPSLSESFTSLFGELSSDQAQRMDELYRGSSQHYRHEMSCSDALGKPRTLSWVHSVLTQNNRPNNILSIGMDVTEQMNVQQQLRWLADHDSLTKLLNRTSLQHQLRLLINRADASEGKLAVLFCDLDKFKQINDSLGHPVGDTLLIQVAERLKSMVRRQDYVARLGGDEFVILLDHLVQPDDAMRIAEKLLHCLAAPYFTEEKELFVSASIGIAFYPQHGEDAISLIKHADIAMYQSKSCGRNQYSLYNPDQSQGLEERLSLNADLHYALQRQEFVLYYQPQLAIDATRIIGVEALIRWRHPSLGVVPPDQFISLAEETGQIVDIGRWVIEEACAQLKRWEQQGVTGVRMAINLAGPQIMSDGLLADVQQALQNSGVRPQQLEFEITETFIMSQPENTIARLHELRDLGIELSVDDFGTGYSSLSYLKKLPVDKLKIDKSFVFDIGRRSDDEAIVKAVIGLGHSLNLKVIAEGVEEQNHVEFLRHNGCDELQGFYFSTPLPADDCLAFILRHQGPLLTH